MSSNWVHHHSTSTLALVLVLCSALLLLTITATKVPAMRTRSQQDESQQQQEAEDEHGPICGGLYDVPGSENSAEIQQLARFAIEEHNKKENAALEFVRLVKAREQMVAGTLHHLTVEAIDAGKKKLYEAKVWVQPWSNFTGLHEFTHLGDAEPEVPTTTSAAAATTTTAAEADAK